MRFARFGRDRVIAAATLAISLGSPAVGAVPADDSYVPVYRPTLRVSRAAGPIRVDGDLGDAGWRGAARAANFAEHSPGNQTKPAVDTEVLVAYDDEHLYVAWLCHDDPAAIRASLCERDRIYDGDHVILCVDTYGEGALAYEFAANPYGVPGDLLYSAANGEDISYDMIFESAGRITDFGYVVEMAIPFRSMRFPRRGEQEWRVDFWRNRPRESRYQYSWAAYDRKENCWPCQWGTVSGISGVEPGSGLELLPSVVAHQSGSLGGDGRFANGDAKGDIGFGISYDVSSELTAEAAFNPDFSQVESDAAQIDVNSTFGLFYPERRPFFQEGSDLFNTYFNAVYTRSINDPIAAAKTIYRAGSNSVAYLAARDEHSVIILPFEERSRFVENGKSWSNILRFRRDLGDQSHIGFLGTDRRFDGGGAGSLLGLDGQMRLSKSDKIRVQLLASRTEEVNNPALADSAFNATLFDGGRHTAGLDGERFWGHAWNARLERGTDNYGIAGQYVELSPTFRADNGFEPSNNRRMGSVAANGILRMDGGTLLENVSGSVDASRVWNFDGVRKDEWVNASAQVKFRAAQTGVHARYMGSNELFGGVRFNGIWLAHVCLSTQPRGSLSFGGNVDYGHRIARRELVMGKELVWGLWADVKPIDRVHAELAYSRISSDDLNTDARLFEQSILRTRLSLQVSRELSARLVLQYNDRYDAVDVDPLVVYRINPLTLFYVGSTHDYRDFGSPDGGIGGWRLANRQFFMKLQYLFRL
jgi:hypothetical protein